MNLELVLFHRLGAVSAFSPTVIIWLGISFELNVYQRKFDEICKHENFLEKTLSSRLTCKWTIQPMTARLMRFYRFVDFISHALHFHEKKNLFADHHIQCVLFEMRASNDFVCVLFLYSVCRRCLFVPLCSKPKNVMAPQTFISNG